MAIAGGSGAGKTTLARALVAAHGGAVRIAHDAYYRHRPELASRERAAQNFDHPEALESELLREHLLELRAGRPVQVPRYDFRTHLRSAESECVEPVSLIAVDGILLLADGRLRTCFDLAVFVDAPEALRFKRRSERDTRERGRTSESVERQLAASVAPMHARFVEPSRAHADLIVAGDRPVAAALAAIARELERRAPGPPGDY